ncbi:hypothetical protein DFJ43DRAFT_216290 [Lentinula guzmanii]|uniref:Zinc-finger domain-containing protein n=1 Tax=Lentinula guzmanii TaxID=2804957 RepID=A0AA38JBL1_9AGAR|nr:hypothetical protein DFJ43DRAFT_216290 [Lentinula guzmanii]
MSATSSPSTLASTPSRRFREVYVEIPPSPFHTSCRTSQNSSIPSRLSFKNVNHYKENTPLQTHISGPADILPRKRKAESSSLKSSTKKSRIEDTMPQVARDKEGELQSCCHHCRAKRISSEMIQCTFLIRSSSKNTVVHRCKTNYCRRCLNHKYSEEFKPIAADSHGQKENGHAEAAHIFKCPKCRGQCGCWRCKHKFTFKSNSESSRTHNLTEPINFRVKDFGNAAAVKKNAHKSIATPILTWLPVPAQLKLKDAEDRIFIREFVLRFSDMQGMSITKAQLEELEFIGGTLDSTDDGDEEDACVNWVSEACVKSLVLSLIGCLAAEEDSSATLVMKNAMKDIRNSGVNLTKIWAILSSLRTNMGRPEVSEGRIQREENHGSDDESSEDRIIFEFPDPLPAPANHNIRSTRSITTDTLPVVDSSQMVPVIVGLIETVLESHAIRIALDDGTKEGKEKHQESRELVKLENELWKRLETRYKSDPSKIKIERQAHKSKIQAFESVARIISSAFLPRSGPLGSDPEGRVYWALTPGVSDREYALDYIISRLPNARKSKRPRNRKQRHRKDNEDSQALREWSWFLAVWGKKPHENGAQCEDEEPQWWGFWDPAEIRKLADWLSITNGSQTDDSSGGGSTSVLKTLVNGITNYANLLEWRILEEED